MDTSINTMQTLICYNPVYSVLIHEMYFCYNRLIQFYNVLKESKQGPLLPICNIIFHTVNIGVLRPVGYIQIEEGDEENPQQITTFRI